MISPYPGQRHGDRDRAEGGLDGASSHGGRGVGPGRRPHHGHPLQHGGQELDYGDG